MDWSIDLELVGRIAVAAVLGLAVGAERERHGHDAGTRTFSVLCAGSATFTVCSLIGFGPEGSTDASRVASQIVVGVGFLGAGLIFRQGVSVQNLTTAAALWSTAAVGVVAGIGQLGLAVAVTAILLLLLLADPDRLRRLLPRRMFRLRLACKLRPGATSPDLRLAFDEVPGVGIDSWTLSKLGGGVVVDVAVHAEEPSSLDRLVGRLVSLDGVDELQAKR